MKTSSSVKHYMARDLVTFTPETNVLSAIRTLIKHKISGAPVVDETGWIVGIVSEFDCLKPILESSYHNDVGTHVKNCMTKNITTINANASLMDAANLFINNGWRRLPVIENKKLVGQISRIDILRAV
ncbi:CBS domain-containing protein, partial [Candidatus Neomarinimicrobiota bacterium]